MSLWSGPPQGPPPPHLKPTFLRGVGVGDGLGGQKCRNNDAPFFCVRNHASFGFFDFEPKKCFWVLNPWGLYGVEWDKQLLAFFAMSSFLATLVTPWYPL